MDGNRSEDADVSVVDADDSINYRTADEESASRYFSVIEDESALENFDDSILSEKPTEAPDLAPESGGDAPKECPDASRDDFELKAENYNFPEGSHRVTLLIDGNNVEAINIGQEIYIYNDANGGLAAFQVLKEDGNIGIKHLLVGKNEDGNIEVYEEQVNQIAVPVEEANAPESEQKSSDRESGSRDLLRAVMERQKSSIEEKIDGEMKISKSPPKKSPKPIVSEEPKEESSEPAAPETSEPAVFENAPEESSESERNVSILEKRPELDEILQNGIEPRRESSPPEEERNLDAEELELGAADGVSTSEVRPDERNPDAEDARTTGEVSLLEVRPDERNLDAEDVSLADEVSPSEVRPDERDLASAESVPSGDLEVGSANEISPSEVLPDERDADGEDLASTESIPSGDLAVDSEDGISASEVGSDERNLPAEDLASTGSISTSDLEVRSADGTPPSEVRPEKRNVDTEDLASKESIPSGDLKVDPEDGISPSEVCPDERNPDTDDVATTESILSINLEVGSTDGVFPSEVLSDERNLLAEDLALTGSIPSADLQVGREDGILLSEVSPDERNLHTEDLEICSANGTPLSVVRSDERNLETEDLASAESIPSIDLEVGLADGISPSEVRPDESNLDTEYSEDLEIGSVSEAPPGESNETSSDDKSDAIFEEDHSETCVEPPIYSPRVSTETVNGKDDKEASVAEDDIVTDANIDEIDQVSVPDSETIASGLSNEKYFDSDVIDDKTADDLIMSDTVLINDNNICNSVESDLRVVENENESSVSEEVESTTNDVCSESENMSNPRADESSEPSIAKIFDGFESDPKNPIEVEEHRPKELETDLVESIEAEKVAAVENSEGPVADGVDEKVHPSIVEKELLANEVADDTQTLTESDDEFEEYFEGEPVTGDSGIDWSDGNITNYDKTTEERASLTIRDSIDSDKIEEMNDLVIDLEKETVADLNAEKESVEDSNGPGDLVMNMDSRGELCEDSNERNGLVVDFDSPKEDFVDDSDPKETIEDVAYLNSVKELTRDDLNVENDLNTRKANLDTLDKDLDVEKESVEDLVVDLNSEKESTGDLDTFKDSVADVNAEKESADDLDMEKDLVMDLDSEKGSVQEAETEEEPAVILNVEKETDLENSDKASVSEAIIVENESGIVLLNNEQVAVNDSDLKCAYLNPDLDSKTKIVFEEPPRRNAGILKTTVGGNTLMKDGHALLLEEIIGGNNVVNMTNDHRKSFDNVHIDIGNDIDLILDRKNVEVTAKKSDFNSYAISIKELDQNYINLESSRVYNLLEDDSFREFQRKNVIKTYSRETKLNSPMNNRIVPKNVLNKSMIPTSFNSESPKILKKTSGALVAEDKKNVNFSILYPNSSFSFKPDDSLIMEVSPKNKSRQPRKQVFTSVSSSDIEIIFSDNDNFKEDRGTAVKSPKTYAKLKQKDERENSPVLKPIAPFKKDEKRKETPKTSENNIIESHDDTSDVKRTVTTPVALKNPEDVQKSVDKIDVSLNTSNLSTASNEDSHSPPNSAKRKRGRPKKNILASTAFNNSIDNSIEIIPKESPREPAITPPVSNEKSAENKESVSSASSKENDAEVSKCTSESGKRKKGRPRKILSASFDHTNDRTPEVDTLKRKSLSNLETCRKSDENMNESPRSIFNASKTDENICPICTKSFRSANVLVKHAKHCNGIIDPVVFKSPKRRRIDAAHDAEKTEDDEIVISETEPVHIALVDSSKPAESSETPKEVDVEEVETVGFADADENKALDLSISSKIKNSTTVDDKIIVIDDGPATLDAVDLTKSKTDDAPKPITKLPRGRPPKKNIEAANKTSPMSRLSRILNMKPPANKVIKCEICGKTFRQLDHMVNHRNKHEAEKPVHHQTATASAQRKSIEESDAILKCEICKKGFRKLHHLVEHREVHNSSEVKSRRTSVNSVKSEPEAFRCDTCDKSFRKLYHLVAHRECHILERSEAEKKDVEVKEEVAKPTVKEDTTCTGCGKSFRKRFHMIEHRDVHCSPLKKRNSYDSEISENSIRLSFASSTSEESNNCGICGKSYRKLHHMVEHRESHAESGAKSNRISTRISSSDALNTKDIIHECPKCYMVFPNVKALNKHTENCLRKKAPGKKSTVAKNQSQIPQIVNKRTSTRTRSNSSTNESVKSAAAKTPQDDRKTASRNSPPKTKLPSDDSQVAVKKPKLEASTKEEDDNVRYKINTNFKERPNPVGRPPAGRLSQPSTSKTKPKLKEGERTTLEDAVVKYSFPRISTVKTKERIVERRVLRRSASTAETSSVKSRAVANKAKSALVTKPKVNSKNVPSLAVRRRSLGGRKSTDGVVKRPVGRPPLPKNRPDLKKTGKDAKKSFKCDCGKQFDNDVQLRKHMDTEHTPPKSFKCQKCGVSVRTAVQFSRHKKTHEGSSSGQASSGRIKKSPRILKSSATTSSTTDDTNKKKPKAAHSGVPLTDKMRKALLASKNRNKKENVDM